MNVMHLEMQYKYKVVYSKKLLKHWSADVTLQVLLMSKFAAIWGRLHKKSPSSALNQDKSEKVEVFIRAAQVASVFVNMVGRTTFTAEWWCWFCLPDSFAVTVLQCPLLAELIFTH